jgi:hypothetical protein
MIAEDTYNEQLNSIHEWGLENNRKIRNLKDSYDSETAYSEVLYCLGIKRY